MKLHSLVIGALLGAASLCASAQQPIVIKFSHVVAADTPKGKGRRALQAVGRGTHEGDA